MVELWQIWSRGLRGLILFNFFSFEKNKKERGRSSSEPKRETGAAGPSVGVVGGVATLAWFGGSLWWLLRVVRFSSYGIVSV